MEYLLLAIGTFSGIISCLIFQRLRKAGYLRIDTSNPNKDVYRFDILIDLSTLPKRKYITLKIDTAYREPLEYSAINGREYQKGESK